MFGGKKSNSISKFKKSNDAVITRVGAEKVIGSSLANLVEEFLGFQLLPWHQWHLLAAEAIYIILWYQKRDLMS